ncbi:MAG: FtsX-like permease family protein [Desulfobacterales bacterium]|nr:FtsX-like permease family protein [Desulfobacterales bacterium]
MHFQVSWRNTWRNPKRTGIILTAIIIGAWTMLIFGGLARGMMASTLSNALNTLTGHIQVQTRAYRDDPAIENRIENPGVLEAVLESTLPPGAKWGFRIRVSGVASNARNSEGVTIVGIDPDREPDLSFYGDLVSQGRLLNNRDDHGIFVGQALMDDFETKLGRKLVLMTQGADLETASRAFKIRGTFRAEMEGTEKQYVFITLKAARKLLGIKNAVTGACIRLPEEAGQTGATLTGLDRTVRDLSRKLPEGLTALPWGQLLPLLKGYLGMFDSFMMLWYLVVFTAMAFGLVNTMLMAVLERTREFGLLKALGMKPLWIIRSVLLECLILLAIGLFAGNLLGFATVQAFAGGIDLSFMAQGSEFFGMGHIIVPFLTLKDVAAINAVIMVLGLLVCLYPAVKAGRITPVEAMAR